MKLVEAERDTLRVMQALLAGVVDSPLFERARAARDWGVRPVLHGADARARTLVRGRAPLTVGAMIEQTFRSVARDPETAPPDEFELVYGWRARAASTRHLYAAAYVAQDIRMTLREPRRNAYARPGQPGVAPLGEAPPAYLNEDAHRVSRSVFRAALALGAAEPAVMLVVLLDHAARALGTDAALARMFAAATQRLGDEPG